MDGSVLEIEDRLRPLYHAAAVMASNYLVALLGAAEAMMIAAGAPREAAMPALSPLIRSTIDNALRLGPVAALTGPIQRGDAGTVAGHLEALTSAPEPVTSLYRAAGLATLDIARRRGLAPERAAAIESMLR